MKTPPTDVAGFGPPASGSGLPLPADADIAAKKTGGCKTSTVELSDSPTLRRGGNSNQSMGAGLDPLDPAPGHYCHTDPMRPTSPRATPPDAGDLGPPSTGRRAYSKLIGTLLATVAAAPVALAVRGFRGTASSPKTMGRVLVLLAMLSTASGWKLPSEPSVEPEMTIIGEEHESPITGGVARNRRRLASDCNSAWCVCPPRPCFPPLPNLAAAFLPAAHHTEFRAVATLQRIATRLVAIPVLALAVLAIAAVVAMATASLAAIPAVPAMTAVLAT